MSHSQPSPRQAPRLADSPWFWLLLFSTVALFALLAIAPKYAHRQGRLDLRLATRYAQPSGESVEAAAAPGELLAEHEPAAAAPPGGEPATDRPARQLPAPDAQEPSPRRSLRPLVVVLFLMLLLSSLRVALVRRQRRGDRFPPPPDDRR